MYADPLRFESWRLRLRPRYNVRGALIDVVIDMPGTILHLKNMSEEQAFELIGWLEETGGDQSRLPPPYTAIRPHPLAEGFRALAQAEAQASAALTTQPAAEAPAEEEEAPAPPPPDQEMHGPADTAESIRAKTAWLASRGMTWEEARSLDAAGKADLKAAWLAHLAAPPAPPQAAAAPPPAPPQPAAPARRPPPAPAPAKGKGRAKPQADAGQAALL